MCSNEDSSHPFVDVKTEFSRLKNICYLDHAATTLYSDKQIEAIGEDLKNNLFGNPHSLNLSSKYCHDTVDQIRYRILQHFGTTIDDYDVVFTGGATSALKSVVEWFDWNTFEGEGKKIDDNTGHFVYTQDNHTSVLGLREIASERGAKIHGLEHHQAFEEFRKIPQRSEGFVTNEGNSLVVYPAQCNFSGCKYPLQWIEKIHSGVLNEFVTNNSNPPRCTRWFCLLDAAAFLSTDRLDLSVYKPDFVAVSFHKIFGYPTGLGALIVKNSSAHVLKKSYYGGGTVLMSMSSDRFHVKKPILHERCEDGTINYLSILSLRHGFETMHRVGGSMDRISGNVFSITQYLHNKLLTLHHCNGQAAVIVYRDTDYSDISSQGNIINFNLLRDNGDYIGYNEVLNIANLYNIHLRTGCFCNPGACQRHLGLTDDQVKTNYAKGHNCADNIDLIHGIPTGSVRVSFGYMSERSDADKLLNMITECFLSLPVVIKVPDDWHSQLKVLKLKFRKIDSNVGNSVYAPIRHNDEPVQKQTTSLTQHRTIKTQSGSITLSRIFVYPIKSCAAFDVKSSWPITERGLKYDREWMIVRNNVAVTQKQIPEMCLIVPQIEKDEKLMFLSYKDFTLKTPIPIDEENYRNVEDFSSNICHNKVCNDSAEVIDCGDTIAQWLEEVLKTTGIRLVKLVNREKLRINSINKAHLSLANQAQYLLINAASVQWLVDHMSSKWNCSFEGVLQRFRSNFVISGECEPLEELEWKKVSIGPFSFEVDGPCQRCQMVCIDQSSGEKSKEPLILLSSALKGKLRFGIYLSSLHLVNSSVLEVGQTVSPLT